MYNVSHVNKETVCAVSRMCAVSWMYVCSFMNVCVQFHEYVCIIYVTLIKYMPSKKFNTTDKMCHWFVKRELNNKTVYPYTRFFHVVQAAYCVEIYTHVIYTHVIYTHVIYPHVIDSYKGSYTINRVCEKKWSYFKKTINIT